jgi:hypothetical protein
MLGVTRAGFLKSSWDAGSTRADMRKHTRFICADFFRNWDGCLKREINVKMVLTNKM